MDYPNQRARENLDHFCSFAIVPTLSTRFPVAHSALGDDDFSTMSSTSSDIFRAAFLADALTLGPHWIYNQGKIARLYPDGIQEFDDPRSNYHPNRTKGQFTHYGDQMVILAKSIAASPKWSLSVFQSIWQNDMTDFDGYLDEASKTTLDNLASHTTPPASQSNDLGGASRFVPALFLPDATLEEKITAAREQTALTHGDEAVIDSAEFFVRAIEALQNGSPLPEALQEAAQANYPNLPTQDWLASAQQALTGDDHLKASANFGLTCHIPEAFPATLYYALRWHQQGAKLNSQNFLTTLSDNSLAGGDTSARAIPLAALLAAAGVAIPTDLWQKLTAHQTLSALEPLLFSSEATSQKITFAGANGDQLDARLELPSSSPRAYAIFAHCFTCGKSIQAATTISRALAAKGIATLRFDFTGLGNSDGDFANTSFLSNVEDLTAAAAHLREYFEAPSILLGHSLGGSAVLAAAGHIPEITHIVTMGAPFDPGHVTHLFENDLPEIRANGQAEVTLAGRKFQIGERFLTDLNAHNQTERIANLKRNLLIMHAPTDTIVGIENAGKIYSAAKHPKSFLSLDKADHLLTDSQQARYAANLVAAWITAE